MKRKLHVLMIIFTLSNLMFSCATSNDVASKRNIQKRKYNKGYYVDFDKKLFGKKDKDNGTVGPGREVDEKEVTLDNETTIASEVKKVGDKAVIASDDVVVLSSESNKGETLLKRADKIGAGADLTRFQKTERMKLRDIQGSNKMIYKPQASKGVKSIRATASVGGGLLTILLVILALILPPLAVLIYEGVTGRFWLVFILWLIAIGVGFFIFGPGVAYLCGLIAAIYAVLIVLGLV